MNLLLEERANEILADRATQGLEPEELQELRDILGDNQAEAYSGFDLAAAAAALSMLRYDDESLPAHLHAKIESDAQAWFAPETVAPTARILEFRPVAKAAPEDMDAAETAPVNDNIVPFPVRRGGFASRAGWYLAAAACLLLALTLAWPYFNQRTGRTAEAQRAQLLATGGDVVALNWQPAGLPEGVNVTGDVVWSKTYQEGYMRFRNLAHNDSQRFTYQLWIFDATRDERYPVDGGYFDVPAGQNEVVIPIKAKLPVNQLALFALTIEPPGGVVVSKREKIVVVAKNL